MKCEFKFCFLCTFDQEKIFTLRGLCDDQNLIDTKYVFLHSLLSKGERTFRGLFGRTNITFDEANGEWDIVKHVPLKKSGGSIIGFTNDTNAYPLGIKKWFLKAKCNTEMKYDVSAELKLTIVSYKQCGAIY